MSSRHHYFGAILVAAIASSSIVHASKSDKSGSSDNNNHEFAHWHNGWAGPPPNWHGEWTWPMDNSSDGKSGKSGSSKGSKGSSDEEPGWPSSPWGPPPNWNAGWLEEPDSGKSGKSGSKSGKGSKGSKSSSDGGMWVWVQHSHHDGWDTDGWSAPEPEPEEGSGKSGKGSDTSGSSGKSGKSDGGDVEQVDDGNWEGDGWVEGEQENFEGGSMVGGWNSDGWDNGGHYKADINYVRAHVTKLVKDSDRELIPKFLRLGFHDCVGGCDGCVDLNNIDNKGLEEPINAIYPIVEKFKGTYSRADIWVMASLVSADLSVVKDRPAGLQFPMRYIGREDCDGADDRGVGGPDVEMPSNHVTTPELLAFFKEHFDFDTEETVIIMGVHAVATAHRDVSGFGVEGEEFGWVFNAKDYEMDNRYYKMLIGNEDPVYSAPLWVGEIVHNEGDIPSRYQWFHEEEGKDERPFMTSADIALVRNLSGYMHDENGVEGIVECAFKEVSGSESESATGSYTRNRSLQSKPLCPVASETLELMIEYKLDNEAWLIDFERVLEKMLRNGYETL
jgi:hypothetical protein